MTAPTLARPAPSPPPLREASSRSIPAVDRRRQYARRARRSDLLVVMLWMSGAIAAALYLVTGAGTMFATPSDAVTSLGILAGLVGTDFILVMLVLAARIPLLDRTIGHDRAIAVHRALGKPALFLLLAHAALLLLGYGMSAGLDPIAEIGPMLALPDLPLAALALGLLIAVVVTSLVAVRRRFGYESWHLIHLLSYVAVAFALPHQLSVGGVLAEGTAQRAYWIALYAVAFGAIGAFRFLAPAVRSVRHRMSVAAVVPIAPGVVSIVLSGRDLRRLGAAGGQFLIWRFWTGSTWWHSHPISLSAMPADDFARITVRELGAGSSRLSRIPVGTRVSFEGPYGLFSDVARTAPKVAILAAGIGVTPIRALLEDSRLRPGEATVLLRAGDDGETYLWDEVREIAEAKQARLFVSTGHRARAGATWLADADAARGVTLASVFPDLADSDLYVCGPASWLDAVVADARHHGVPSHRIHAERFDW
ncbi:ferric reductase-like transmembrane domain-containing protein [Pseudolysinimonas sp.]|jgi:predicted ferric reductase|uniref:ferredoxin reductase family protein n=1 Tax=Pseudolysinimonas sp. TaxID=2680009 RepID=UPI003782F4FB